MVWFVVFLKVEGFMVKIVLSFYYGEIFIVVFWGVLVISFFGVFFC